MPTRSDHAIASATTTKLASLTNPPLRTDLTNLTIVRGTAIFVVSPPCTRMQRITSPIACELLRRIQSQSSEKQLPCDPDLAMEPDPVALLEITLPNQSGIGSSINRWVKIP